VVAVDLAAVEPDGLGVVDDNLEGRAGWGLGGGDEAGGESGVVGEGEAWFVEGGLRHGVVARVEGELDDRAGQLSDVVGGVGEGAVEADVDGEFAEAAGGEAVGGRGRGGGFGGEGFECCECVVARGRGVDGVHHARLAVVADSLGTVYPDGLGVVDGDGEGGARGDVGRGGGHEAGEETAAGEGLAGLVEAGLGDGVVLGGVSVGKRGGEGGGVVPSQSSCK